MKINKIPPLIAAGILGLSMLACNLGKGPGPVPSDAPTPQDSSNNDIPVTEESTSSGACENPYYPVKAGATWVYQISGNVSDTMTRSILTTDAENFTDQDVFGNGFSRKSQWQCDNGNLIAGDAGNSISSTANVGGVSADFHTTELSGVTIPYPMNNGDTWTQSFTLEGTESVNGTQFEAKNQTTNSCTAIGIESVTVTAGTFDAMRVDCLTTINITIGASTTPVSLVTNNSNWYAENIGLIKTVSTGTNLDSTIELVSYTIP